ncbi:MAG: hypothetical protein KatS3mg057_2896 [Herpetosiphonaceae bacterium]|nr:MAG: hypothetical protein KatS3mg057_2896 [Herpetosiphonaceae bacterium]
MAAEENKTLVRRVIEEGFNKGNLGVADQLCASNYRSHDPLLQNLPSGPDAFKQSINVYRTAFPDSRITIEEQVAQGNLVATRWTAQGTHNGQLMGIQPTGKRVQVSGIQIDRVEQGKIVETWINYDALGMMQQLGVVSTQALQAGR